MSRSEPGPYPTVEQLDAAEALAKARKSCTGIYATDRAIYAYGTEAWVCPFCGTFTEPQMPLGPVDCGTCEAVLEPW